MLPSVRFRRTGRHKKPGTAPGTIEHIGERHMDEIKITVHDYDEEHIDEIPISKIQKVQPYLDAPSKTWVQVQGLHDTEKLKSIWNFFDLHTLIQEDIVHTAQRPKVEVYDNCIFFVLCLLSYSKEEQKIQAEQISIVLGKNYVLSFQETDVDHFKPIINRLAIKGARIRKQNADYLMYALVDTVVDYYFNIIEHIADDIEGLEDELLQDPEDHLLNQIHKIRREIIFFRKQVWPLRDAINATIRDESQFIDNSTKIYLRDVYDHMIQVIDNIENYRDMILGLQDMYMSHVSNKMNEVMKVLTIIATIFIPLTFVAGIYGMNFDPGASPYNMPELSWYWGYPASLGGMTILALIMIFFFKRKGWF
ncbi:magnesium and cobalt transport protein CorA [Aliifodinibius salipaludis]|uniref:Magnesium transport protein CorA n=2 Tax=Fodinibius salipaludis TaxID=2032627 RepID=A0A2A2G6E0_9BACT|nr:magnesium and cobalt transport protein CorA [Aliifodinibius salipaludis]